MPRPFRLALLTALALTALPAAAQRVETVAEGVAGRVSVPGFPATGLPGQAASDQFGYVVAAAGDVNGDGHGDLIAGAPFSDGGGADAGRAYVYYGGPLADATPDLTLTGATAGDAFGVSVAGAGDLNGDGFADLVVGAYFNDAVGTSSGRAYVYYGGTAPDAVPDLTLTGETAGSLFGASVVGAGDLNGDGYGDLAVGAYGYSSSRGRAYVFLGGQTPDATPDLTVTGVVSADQLGRSIAGAGDVNGDGYADLLVGVALDDTAGSQAGRASVYYGGATLNATVDLTMTGEAADDNFGYAVAGAGDVNGDGYADVLVGGIGNDAGGNSAGRAYVYYGGAAPDALADLTMTGTGAIDLFGFSVAGAGDVNGDGYADVLVGASLNDGGGLNAGRAYVFYGGGTANATPDLVITGEAAGDQLGYSVAAAGDLDGDGLGDLAVGAPNRDASFRTDAGVVHLISNSNTGTGASDWQAFGTASFDDFGRAVAGAGDVNGDGYADVLVGARFNDAGGADAGRAYLYFGGPTADATADLTLTGTGGESFGVSVAGPGDLNGDGYDDVVVGASLNDAGGGDAGQAYVYYGGPAPDALPDLTLTGETAGSLFGVSVAGVGDVNGDGFADLGVGASGYSASRGRTYVYFGGPSLGTSPNRTYTGAAAPDRFGLAVSGAGDVNGDGYADLLVGAPFTDAGAIDAGSAYVFYGGPVTDLTADLTLIGAAANDQFGTAVAGAGDVTGDGYADVLVGAPLNDLSGVDAGRATLYFGGPMPDASADRTFTDAAASDQFGTGVAGVGDVDGDGYADLAVGAFGNDVPATNTGRAYVYYGGPAGDATPDLTLAGSAASDQFGFAVTGAGDINGDGRADVLVGAYAGSAGGLAFGAAYLYRATGPAAAPGLYRLADVPGDQGGAVDLRWTRSDQETQGAVTAYRVERSHPAGAAGYAWEPLATVMATGRERYSLAAATYADQTAANAGTACYQVTADGAGGTHWRSVVRCGASIDNLAPAAPPALAVGASPDGDALVTVSTLLLPPSDLAGYTVFRSTDAACDAADAPVATVPDGGTATVTFEDQTVDFGTDVYYCAASVDAHGNRSAVTAPASANPSVLAAVRVVLEGAYRAGLPNGQLMRADLEGALPLAQPYGVAPWSYAGTEAVPPTDADLNGRPDVLDQHAVVDWVLVCLRGAPAAADAGCGAALLLADGTLLAPGGGAAVAAVRPAAAGSYHVVVYHRNHLPAMSRYLVALDGAAPADAYDLAASPSLVYGSNAVKSLGGGLYALFGGNGDGNGAVLAPDRQVVWEPTVGQAGYLPGDYTLDGSVLADDRQALWAPNVGAQSAVPGENLVPDGPDGPDATRRTASR